MGELLDNVLKSLDKAVVTDIRCYDMRNRTPFYDYAVIASVSTSRQGAAAANYIKDDASEKGFDVRNNIPSADSDWYLVDLNDVVVHIFVGDARTYYNLDEMYKEHDA